MQRLSLHHRQSHDERRGAATVEFAVTLPVFLTLLLGMVELGLALNSTQTLHGALRDAGRLASMDYVEMFGSNVDPNAKIMQDIKNLLTASGIPGDQTTVSIVHAGGTTDGQTFDLNEEDNYLKLFRIEASVPYSAVSMFPVDYMAGQTLQASATFRKGRVSLVDD